MSFIDGFSTSRVLNLTCEQDRKQALDSAAFLPELHSLLLAHLEDYVRFLGDSSWQTVYGGGLIVPTSGRRGVSFNLADAMTLTRTLVRLEDIPGFPGFLAQFKNPSQIAATIFEARVAEWCLDRKAATSIELSPHVRTARGSIARPDFLWHTARGDLYCECKSGVLLETKARSRLVRAFSELKRSYARHPSWSVAYRLDVRVRDQLLNESLVDIDKIVDGAIEADRAGTQLEWGCSDRRIEVKFRKRGEKLDQSHGELVMQMAQVDTKGVSLGDAAHLTLAMPTGGLRSRMVAHFAKEARRQLPSDGARGAVFIEMFNTRGLSEKLETLVSQDEYARTPWISLWSRGAFMSATYRLGQPFDESLMIPS